MAHKDWDKVRDHRLYSYLNQQEMENFLEAMRLRDIGQPSTAVRTFINERSDQIIIEHRQDKYKQSSVTTPTVNLRFPSGKNTVVNFLN